METVKALLLHDESPLNYKSLTLDTAAGAGIDVVSDTNGLFAAIAIAIVRLLILFIGRKKKKDAANG